MDKIYIVIGTRAQLIKMAPVMIALQNENRSYEFIYTAQHSETISEILRDFGVKDPDRVLYHGHESNTIGKGVKWLASMIAKSLNPKGIFPQKGIVLTHGDTVTTAWTAITAKLIGCKVGHVESGIRTFNIFKPFPEELMRIITFSFSDYYFCQSKMNLDNVKKYKGEKINLGLNTVYDGVKIALNSDVKVSIPSKKYAVVSIHRFENIYTKKLEDVIIPILEKIAKTNIDLVFILHPSIREVLRKKKLFKKLEGNKRIILKKRYPYFEFIKLLSKSEFLITDGGSNQEETAYMGIPCLLLKNSTGRPEGVGENAVMSYFDEKICLDFVKNYKEKERQPLNSKESPSKKIVEFLKNQIES